MPRKPKIVKDSDNFAIRFVGMQRLTGMDYFTSLPPTDAKRLADGIRSLRAERDAALRDLEAARGIRRAAREC